MADLQAVSANCDDVDAHVIFVHGITGDIRKTWTSQVGKESVFWPDWLSEDLPRLGIWLIGYPAASTNWSGSSLPLADRADNILARLLVEPRLQKGNLIFIAHSMGGLIVQQLLRSAERDENVNRNAESLLSRTKRVALLGTPHRGAFLATLAVRIPLLRASSSTKDLPLGSPQLKDLNHWYRRFCQSNHVDNLLLAEGLPERKWFFSIGRIVSSDSADAGLADLTVTVDETHQTICKPKDRSSEVYAQIKGFISRPFDRPPHANTRMVEAINAQSTEVAALGANIADLAERFLDTPHFDTAIVDKEVRARLDILLKRRLFANVEAVDETRRLLSELTTGALSSASRTLRDEAFAWCARLLSTDFPDDAQAALDQVHNADGELARVARAFIHQARGEQESALSELNFDRPLCRGASLICQLKKLGFVGAKVWLRDAGIGLSELDSSGKYFYLGGALTAEDWSTAFEVLDAISDQDFERTPALLVIAAGAHLAHAIPDELRAWLRYVPLNAASFPLRSEPSELERRRSAADIFSRAELVAYSLDVPAAAAFAGDMALWLRLMDPAFGTEARKQLGESVRDPVVLLRRFSLALQFGIQVDQSLIEREVDRQTALTAAASPDAAVARFSLALSRKDPASVAAYLAKHRDQLLRHLDPAAVYSVEVEALAKAGQRSQAEVRLDDASRHGLRMGEVQRLRGLLDEIAGNDPIAWRLDSYNQSGSVSDLHLLVDAYADASDWKNAVEFGKILVDRTGDISAARRYLIALYNQFELDEALKLIDRYPALLERYSDLLVFKARLFYERGDLLEARNVLAEARKNGQRQTHDGRLLLVDIAIASGDWDSLQGFVETEWAERNQREPADLLRAGHIAQVIGVRRGVDLVREAASRANDDPNLLVGCYHAATKGGWELRKEAGAWLQRAVDISGGKENSPIQSISLEQVLERKPAWDKQEAEAWRLLSRGELPLMAVGTTLNRTLISLLLSPAIGNQGEKDVRKRRNVYAFSGSRAVVNLDPKTIALEPTALLSAELLGLLDTYFEAFECIFIPHGTLGWLLVERAETMFHQPSRVAASRELKVLIAQGHLKEFDGSHLPSDRLIDEVGESLAELLHTAASESHSDATQRLVVCVGPVYRASTFMREEANISAFLRIICGCVDVVNKLEQVGVLSLLEADEARQYLSLRERSWPTAPTIDDGAVLYLDDVASAHLESLGLLSKLHLAGLSAVLSRRRVTDADSLIAYDAKASDEIAIVDQLRGRLTKGISEGKVRLGKAVRVDSKDDPHGLASHPTSAMLTLIARADAGVSDDRFINQHAFINFESGAKPLLTTLDVLNVLQRRLLLTDAQHMQARTTLRRAGYILLPIDADELVRLLESAKIHSGRLVETAELKAIRENLQRVRMGDSLQFPKEMAWLNGLFTATHRALRAQWVPEADEEVAAIKSDWLLALADIRSWAHSIKDGPSQLAHRHRSMLGALMCLTIVQPESVRLAYWRWFSSRILNVVLEEDPATHAYLVARAKEVVSGLAASADDFEAEHGRA